ncbi:IPTL-CTERM sorting domain-containing protein [Comamonas sp. 4034]|uniref:IPTL-CTERM sorting domain-containing protein n=1 Tax=Comamonas sp. 4034 TaxID=3156455 RepID=UPI003D245F97
MKKVISSLLFAFCLAIPGLSMGAFVSGPVTYEFSSIYSGTSKDLTYDSNGAPYSDLSVLLICIDHGTNPPFTYDIPIAQFDTQAGASAIKGLSGAAGEAAIYWLLDQYYEEYYKSSVEKRRALQYALWEIGNDYDGTAASIDIARGSSRPSLEDVTQYGGSDQAAFVDAYTALYAAMRANLPTLRATYRSSKYTMDLFRNRDPKYQHMVALIEKAPPNTVPLAEPAITGTPRIGSPVTGSYTYADNDADVEDPSGTSYRFVTSPSPTIAHSNEGIVVASGSTGGDTKTVSYTLQPADLNQYLYFCVTPAAQTGATPGLEVCSRAAGPVAVSPAMPTPTPVPNLGVWGLIALSSLLAAFGLVQSRRRTA